MKWPCYEGDGYFGNAKFKSLLELNLISFVFLYFLSLGSLGQKIPDIWNTIRMVYEANTRYCQISHQLTWPCGAGWDLTVQKRMNKKCHSLNWNKKEVPLFPLFDKGRGFTCEVPWLHYLCVLKMWKLCTQQHCPMWKTNVYLFTVGRKFHKCMKCSLHMYPTSPHPCPQERNYLFICLSV